MDAGSEVGLISCRCSTYTTLEPTLRVIHDPLLVRHFEVSLKHLQRLVDLDYRQMFRLWAVLGSTFRRQDDRSHCVVVWSAQGCVTHTRLVHDVWSSYIDCTQGLETWYMLVPFAVRTMSQLFWLWDSEVWLVD